MLRKPQPKTLHPTDILVGSRIRLQRTLKKISQTRLADGLGITFQQIQKYEKGTNRVSPSRLQAIADILGVPASYFFEDELNAPSATTPSQAIPSGSEFLQFLNSEEGVNLNRDFSKVRDPKVRQKILSLIKALANEAFE
ncbi:helix-turn-helix transcriptional regulator [Rhizobium sp. P40RR-XXII]|nr:helix-turn-helix transcriptional regulator [Rhizobium sp. P40RR-XXII]